MSHWWKQLPNHNGKSQENVQDNFLCVLQEAQTQWGCAFSPPHIRQEEPDMGHKLTDIWFTLPARIGAQQHCFEFFQQIL